MNIWEFWTLWVDQYLCHGELIIWQFGGALRQPDEFIYAAYATFYKQNMQ